MFGVGGKLATADRTTRAVAGGGLIVAGVLLGFTVTPPAWVTALAIGVGAVLVVEATINYCPLARTWPWNRSPSTETRPDSRVS